MSEVIDGNKVKTEEKEVFIEESYVTPEPPVIYMSDEDVKAFDDQQEVMSQIKTPLPSG